MIIDEKPQYKQSTGGRKVYWLAAPEGVGARPATLRGEFLMMTDDEFYAKLSELAGSEVGGNDHEGDAFLQEFSKRRQLTAIMRDLFLKWPYVDGTPRDIMVLTKTYNHVNPTVPNSLFMTADAAFQVYDNGHARIKGDSKGIFLRWARQIKPNQLVRY